MFNGIFMGYLMPKSPMWRNNSGTIWIKAASRDMWVNIFPWGISPKVNPIAGLEFKLAYYHFTAQHVSHYATVIIYFYVYIYALSLFGFDLISLLNGIPISVGYSMPKPCLKNDSSGIIYSIGEYS